MNDGEAGVAPLRCHALLQQFPRLGLLIVRLNAAQQRVAVVPATASHSIISVRQENATLVAPVIAIITSTINVGLG